MKDGRIIIVNSFKSNFLAWVRWQYVKLFQRGRMLSSTLPGGLTISFRQTDRFAKSLIRGRTSEPEYTRLIQAMLKPGMVYIDIGAHIGQYVLIGAQLVGSHGQVHAFEPTPDTFELLEANIRQNNLSWCTANPLAVCDLAGQTLRLQLCAPGKEAFNALCRPLRPDQQILGATDVQTVTIDSYCQERRIDRVDFIKIDVNGPELMVVRGAERVLRQHKPVLVCEFNNQTHSYSGYQPTDLIRHLQERGYDLFEFDSDRMDLVSCTTTQFPETVNLVAVHRQHGLRSGGAPGVIHLASSPGA